MINVSVTSLAFTEFDDKCRRAIYSAKVIKLVFTFRRCNQIQMKNGSLMHKSRIYFEIYLKTIIFDLKFLNKNKFYKVQFKKFLM